MSSAPTILTRPLIMLAALACLPACSGLDDSSSFDADSGGSGLGTDGADTSEEWGTDTGVSTSGGDGDPGDGDPDQTDPGMAECDLDCGDGTCVWADGDQYCECPEATAWATTWGQGCGDCPLLEGQSFDVDVGVVDYAGEFLVEGGPAPLSEYDDANIWLENQRSGDRVLLGNTHDLSFAVRVTPGIYDLVYEVETPGPQLPHNSRVVLTKLALFATRDADIEIPVARLSGAITLDGAPPPLSEYDDANLYLRDNQTGGEVLVANTHDLDYSLPVVPGAYDLIYRVETPGDLIPRNHGAVLERDLEAIEGSQGLGINIQSVRLQGEFSIADNPPPISEYDDANIELSSEFGGTVALGNTHDLSFDVPVLPDTYDVVYMHETGVSVPQNQRARFASVLADGLGPTPINVPMVTIDGALTINNAAPPVSEYDDGVVHMSGVDSDDTVILANTHDGSYSINLIPGTYDVYYSQETAGGVVPENKRARVAASVDLLVTGTHDVDIEAVSISGAFTVGGVAPPSSVYEDGRLYLRNAATNDALLLGSTHGGSYSAVVVPGDYELFYTQEAGGEVPSNQNASLGSVTIAAQMVLDLDVPVVDLSGEIFVDGQPAPTMASDGGQIYLRGLDGDSALLGDSFAQGGYAARLVAGTYGVYYRSEASLTTPQNENGRVACVRVE